MKCKYLGCGKKTKIYKYICDKHAEKQETKPYGKFCEGCGADLFEEECRC